MTDGIIRVGVSGWTHAAWRGPFYPRGMPREQELGFAAARFRTIEANAAFYGPQRPETFVAWAGQVPAGFRFAVRAPRSITHGARLTAAEGLVARFLGSGILLLGPHLGPVVWQFPANLPLYPARLAAFLRALPQSTGAAAALAACHHGHARHAPPLRTDRRLHHAIDAPHASFACQGLVDLLREHNIAQVIVDAPTRPAAMDVTADFVLCRLQARFADGYAPGELERWARHCKAWATGTDPDDAPRLAGRARPRKRDVFVLFDSHARPRAPANAQELIRRLRA